MATKSWEEEMSRFYGKGKPHPGVPNDPLSRTLLRSALDNAENVAKGRAPRSLLHPDGYNPESGAKSVGANLDSNHASFDFPIRSACPIGSHLESENEDSEIRLRWVSDEEKGINEALERAKADASNRETMLIARRNYDNFMNTEGSDLYGRFKKIARFPELFQAQLDRATDPVMKWAHAHQRDIMILWLSAFADNELAQYVYYMPYYRILDYEIGRRAHDDLIKRSLNVNAKKALGNILRRLDKLSDKRVNFDMAAEPPEEWHSVSHQHSDVKHPFGEESLKYPQYLALGNYSLIALAKGYTEPLSDGGHKICVTGLSSAVNDSVDYNGFQWLAPWRHKDLVGPGDDISLEELFATGTNFFNWDFTNFKKHTWHGKDFRVVSHPHEIPLLEEKCWRVK